MCFSILSSQAERVPNPALCWSVAKQFNMAQQITEISGICLNSALEAAANETLPHNRVFSPHNWIKAKTCLNAINQAIRQYFNMLPTMPNGKEMSKALKQCLILPASEFEDRWAAD
jgi:hypothetical protein